MKCYRDNDCRLLLSQISRILISTISFPVTTSILHSRCNRWHNCANLRQNTTNHIVHIDIHNISTTSQSAHCFFLRYGAHKVFGSLPAVTVTFDLLTPKSISTSTNPNTSATKIEWNFLHWFYGVHKVSGSLAVVTLAFDLLPQNLNSTSTNPNTSVTKIGWISFIWFLRYCVHSVFGTHRRIHTLITHSLTDGQTRIQNNSDTVFQRHKNLQTWRWGVSRRMCILPNR